MFFHILCYRLSSILQGIYFLIRVYVYKKIKGLNSRKMTSLPNSQNVINFVRHLLISVVVENKPHAYHDTHGLFLSPVFTVAARNAWDHDPPFGEATRKKKEKETPAFLESRS